MKVLVTGGAGFIGAHIVEQLLNDGAEVRVLDLLDPRLHPCGADQLDPRAELIAGDIRDQAVMRRAVAGVDAVCHQAAKVGLGVDFGDIGSYVAHNDVGTAVLLEALWQRGFGGRLVPRSPWPQRALYRAPTTAGREARRAATSPSACSWGRPRWSIYPALLLVAVVGLGTTRLSRSLGRAAAAAGGLAVVAYLPHVWVAGWRVVGYLPGYLKEEHFDRGGRFLLAGTLGLPGQATAALAALGLLAAVGWVLWRWPSFPHGAAVLLAAVFLTATPVQPWYACSLLAIATLTSWPWWAAVNAAGYPYFFAVILDDPHPAGLGRACYAVGLAVLGIAYYFDRRRASVSTMTVSPNRAVMADVLH